MSRSWFSAPDLDVGQTVGPYRLEALLGEGGMARVFRARNDADGTTVALKVMKRDFVDDDVYRHRFVHEARSAAEVRHEHLVPILDAGEAEGHQYIAAGYIEGETLEQRIGSGDPLPIAEIVRLTTDVASGLDALHAAGVVHRDIKSSNILIDKHGTARLTDFGLAKGRTYTALTKPGQVLGTLDYLAPELIRGEKATAGSDIYALGCVVFECITGTPPFAHKTMFEVGVAHLAEDPADPSAARDDCPPAVGHAVLRALEKDPGERPGTATDFATSLQNAAR